MKNMTRLFMAKFILVQVPRSGIKVSPLCESFNIKSNVGNELAIYLKKC